MDLKQFMQTMDESVTFTMDEKGEPIYVIDANYIQSYQFKSDDLEIDDTKNGVLRISLFNTDLSNLGAVCGATVAMDRDEAMAIAHKILDIFGHDA